jgi:hypothetical protein
MSHPLRIEGTRVCVLVHPDEVVVCANIQGFKALCAWMSWLAESDPAEFFHFHLLWHLESEASKFDGELPKNVWVLQTPKSHQVVQAPPEGMQAVPFDLTFQVISESALDELAEAQSLGFIPEKYLKSEASYVGDCG